MIGTVPQLVATVIADARLDQAGEVAIGHYTQEKNSMTARAALEMLAMIEEEGQVARAAELGSHAAARLRKLAGRCPHETTGNVLTLSPPLAIARLDLDRALDILEAAVLEDGPVRG